MLADPPPKAYLVNFADSGINLRVGLWLGDPREGSLGVVSDINLAVWRRFRDEGIEIPFPQREVRILPPLPAFAAGVRPGGRECFAGSAGLFVQSANSPSIQGIKYA